jgi:hypothetical protein
MNHKKMMLGEFIAEMGSEGPTQQHLGIDVDNDS